MNLRIAFLLATLCAGWSCGGSDGRTEAAGPRQDFLGDAGAAAHDESVGPAQGDAQLLARRVALLEYLETGASEEGDGFGIQRIGDEDSQGISLRLCRTARRAKSGWMVRSWAAKEATRASTTASASAAPYAKPMCPTRTSRSLSVSWPPASTKPRSS